MMCLPPDPMRFPDNPNQGGSYYDGVEYQTGGQLNHADDHNTPCAVCEVTGKSTILMIPSHYECPAGWRMEYNGYIMLGRHSHVGNSMYNCIGNKLVAVVVIMVGISCIQYMQFLANFCHIMAMH